MNTKDYIGDTTIAHVARMHCRDGANHPVKIIEGNSAPHFTGSAGYFTTMSGKTIVKYPNACELLLHKCSSFLDLRLS